ncbi:MAG: NTP transferase domain-containing protein [Lachnospiraceae bacterium]|nr:NTP transferase domain-containing protein [Lachnospiraceae bacterium]
MKCLILAGGRGDRMWPLSRKNNPKQFMQIKNNHSIFQDTIARNMAFCDEFIISTGIEYESIIENQMRAFRGLNYRCIYEEEGRNTAAPVILAALSLNDSETLFVASSDHLIKGDSYKDSILDAKKMIKNGKIVTFGMDIVKPDTRFGYIRYSGEDVIDFTEKPDSQTAEKYYKSGDYYINSGMFMFNVGDFLYSLDGIAHDELEVLREIYLKRQVDGGNTFYSGELFCRIESSSIEKVYFEKSSDIKVIHATYGWQDVGSLDDLDDFDIQSVKEEQIIYNKCDNTTVINQSTDKLVLVNHLKDVMVVNTDDAVYIGAKGQSNDLKEIIRASESMWGYFDKSSVYYANWGEYHVLSENRDKGILVSKVIVLPGHTYRYTTAGKDTVNISIINGTGLLKSDKGTVNISVGESYPLDEEEYRISCTSEDDLIFVETITGMVFNDTKLNFDQKGAITSEASLGYTQEPFVKLSPIYKDYLWGGTKLRDEFGKECDYDLIAESWELSAHPDGQSRIASGQHKGITFGDYLHKIGDEGLGWKYVSGRAFPLLIKLIDARDDLSVQVHPGDDYALEHENEYGKSELWHILEAEEGACLYVGFRKDVTEEEVRHGITEGNIINMLNRIDVKPDETYYIPAGTVHAIGKGCLICEVQQNSNCTYRLYDYDRVDKYGHRRRLDIDKALDVLDYKAYKGNEDCKYFQCEFVKSESTYSLSVNEESFIALLITDGEGQIDCRINKETYKDKVCKGDCIFVPGRKKTIHLKGNMNFAVVRL